MDIFVILGIVTITTTFTITVFGICYILQNIAGTVICDNWCRRGSIESSASDADGFRPQDYVFRGTGASCPLDVTVVFIDHKEYQQLYLQSLKRQHEQVRSNPRPSAPPSPGPPPYALTE